MGSVAEIACGIVLIALCDGHRQLARRRDCARQELGAGVARLHAALPQEEHGVGRKLVHPRKVDDVADVEEHDELFEVLLGKGEHIALLRLEIVAPLLKEAVPVLPRGAAQDDDGGLRARRNALHEVLRKGHFGIVERPVAPIAVVDGVLLRPLAVGLQQLEIGCKPALFQDALRNAHPIGLDDVAARAVARIEAVRLRPPEEGKLILEGQRAVVFEQHRPFRRGTAEKFAHRGIYGGLSLRRQIFTLL